MLWDDDPCKLRVFPVMWTCACMSGMRFCTFEVRNSVAEPDWLEAEPGGELDEIGNVSH